MKILVVGSGGREAAMVWKLSQSKGAELYCAPGNAGIAELATCVPLKADDIEGLFSFAQKESIDLTVVGPEVPLVLGIANRFREGGRLICGPGRKAAKAEGSKAYFKQFLSQNGLPTAPYEIFKDPREALAYVRGCGPQNIVIKADGLMAGKGVTLPESIEEAERDIEGLMVAGSPGETVVIEKRLLGVERSVMAATDGTTVRMLPFTQDYKRERDDDRGRNTGGMGAHTLSLTIDEGAQLEALMKRVVNAFRENGIVYAGFIYLGVMMTEHGPMILECNCRLGDPETQVILPSIECDFAALCLAIAQGSLAKFPPPIQKWHALSVVLASGEYPASSVRDDPILGITEAKREGALVFHAGTALKNGVLHTNKSGRVLSVVGRAGMLLQARELAYRAAQHVTFPGKKYRGDIAKMAALAI